MKQEIILRETRVQVQQCAEEAGGGLTRADEALMTSQSDKHEGSVGRNAGAGLSTPGFRRLAALECHPSPTATPPPPLLSRCRGTAPFAFTRGKPDLHFVMFHEPGGLSGISARKKDSQPCKLIKWRGSHFGIFSLSLFS